jgi:hypothetical protein
MQFAPIQAFFAFACIQQASLSTRAGKTSIENMTSRLCLIPRSPLLKTRMQIRCQSTRRPWRKRHVAVKSPSAVNASECLKAAEGLYSARQVRRAIPLFQRALDGGFRPGHCSLRLWECWMLLGKFERAWAQSDRDGFGHLRIEHIPRRRIAIRCSRGFGDAIQFLRYAPLLQQHCGSVAVFARDRLLALLEAMPGIEQIGLLEQLDDERAVEASDLPLLFRSTVATLPRTVPYIAGIHPHPRLREEFTVGIAWGAGDWNRSRSIPLREFAPLAEIPGVTLFALQRGPEAGQLKSAPFRIHDAEPENSDMLHTAALISRLDLIITVDTMVAHLAGALGRPVWTLLQYIADWRWMLGREDTPWYPSMRLFRQANPGDWRGVIRDVAAELRSHAGGFKNCASLT